MALIALVEIDVGHRGGVPIIHDREKIADRDVVLSAQPRLLLLTRYEGRHDALGILPVFLPIGCDAV